MKPKRLRLSPHARARLEERKNPNDIYNTRNLMKSNCKWYTKEDLIESSPLYIHAAYVCRKEKNTMRYITDGKIEVLYNKDTEVVITIMEVKDKFLPITQYIKPRIMEQIQIKKETKKMRKKVRVCPDCGKQKELTHKGLCTQCYTRQTNAKHRGKEYIPYVKLSDKEKARIDAFQMRNSLIGKQRVKKNQERVEVTPREIKITEEKEVKSKVKELTNDLLDKTVLINTLRNYGCEIPENNLNDILNVLVSTDKLKDIFMTIVTNENQQGLLDLEQALNVVERKLQHDWEYNGFQQEDDIKFKNFLTWRRTLKGAIFFWKKLYQTNALIEMQRAWNAYTQDPNEKILLAGDRIDSMMKRYQITTESISTIFNTRRPFTRVFYASDKDIAYNQFVKWLADRQLHEDKSKTTIVELGVEGEDGRKETQSY